MSPHFSNILYNRLLLLVFYVSLAYSPCHGTLGIKYNHIRCLDNERDALLQFKRGIRIDRCGLLDSWGETRDCCSWGGIQCNNRSGNVISLVLPTPQHDSNDYINYINQSCLEGTLSASLFDLKSLVYLDLSFNDFQGHIIPKIIGTLSKLEHFNLSHANFSGVVPQEIGNLSRLSFLDLQHNTVNEGGSNKMRVESLEWLSRLRLLRLVNLAGINLSVTSNTWLSIVNNLPFLQKLVLDGCQLSLNSPYSLSSVNSSTTLSTISLRWNNLKDTSIFDWLFNLTTPDTNLLHLSLSSNQLFTNDLNSTKRAMKVISNFCSLNTLDLYDTNLNYDVADIIQFFSACPHKPLVKLELGKNRVWGNIPDTIDALSSLREFYVNENQLNGIVTNSLWRLPMLESLDISSNSFNGTISNRLLTNLSKLVYLGLGDNTNIIININTNWIPPFQLSYLFLSGCKLGPSFPTWLLTQKRIQLLDISNTSISDTIPISFWNQSLWSRMNSFNMSHNMIYGTLPDISITFPSYMVYFDLSYNKLEGALPPFLRNNITALHLNNNNFSKGLVPFFCSNNTRTLLIVHLSSNMFFEKLPDCWRYFDQLLSIHLENNTIWGNIPNSIGTLYKLVTLHLRNNNLSGKLPMSLLNCSSLVFLDLANNSLTGYIPPNFGHSFKNLGIITLHNNSFSGSLPSSICHLYQLQLLDLSQNLFSGTIPKCIYKLKGMANTNNMLQNLENSIYSLTSVYDDELLIWKGVEHLFKGNKSGLLKGIDMSNNMLHGQIPEKISNLIGLKFLNMSHNRLSGPIVPTIGQMTSLESLDLSNNRLSGKIPTSLAQVASLAFLDLSNNNLSGKIPDGIQLQTFNASAYMGNSKLCGAPLQKCSRVEVTTIISQAVDNKKKVENINLGLYISLVIGFISGFWGVCGTLVLKRSWRHAFFRFCEDKKDKIYVIVIVNTCKILKRS